MKVKYKDINTGETKVANLFAKDYILNTTKLVDDDGTFVVVCEWQIIR